MTADADAFYSIRWIFPTDPCLRPPLGEPLRIWWWNLASEN